MRRFNAVHFAPSRLFCSAPFGRRANLVPCPLPADSRGARVGAENSRKGYSPCGSVTDQHLFQGWLLVASMLAQVLLGFPDLAPACLDRKSACVEARQKTPRSRHK